MIRICLWSPSESFTFIFVLEKKIEFPHNQQAQKFKSPKSTDDDADVGGAVNGGVGGGFVGNAITVRVASRWTDILMNKSTDIWGSRVSFGTEMEMVNVTK